MWNYFLQVFCEGLYGKYQKVGERIFTCKDLCKTVQKIVCSQIYIGRCLKIYVVFPNVLNYFKDEFIGKILQYCIV